MNSPGLAFRADDDTFVFEIGSRFLRAGLGGESQPRYRLSFGPEPSAKLSEHAANRLHEKQQSSKALTYSEWAFDHELWQVDVRELDLGLVGDKLERRLREAIADYVLVMDDAKKRSFCLVVPSLLPQPLLSVLLRCLFECFPQPQKISLFASSLMCSICSGLRSALVVDIGWAEVTVTAVYEYREVLTKKSCQAMKLLSWNLRNRLLSYCSPRMTLCLMSLKIS